MQNAELAQQIGISIPSVACQRSLDENFKWGSDRANLIQDGIPSQDVIVVSAASPVNYLDVRRLKEVGFFSLFRSAQLLSNYLVVPNPMKAGKRQGSPAESRRSAAKKG